MRRLGIAMLVLLSVVACGPKITPSSGVTGATSSEEAIVTFLGAARAQDLQAVSAVWGNDESPTRDRVERQELERRLMIIVCHLRHDESRIGSAQSGEGGRTLHQVELTKGTIKATVPFTTVRNSKNGRWYVEDVDLRSAREICSSEQMTRPAQRP